MTRRVVLKPDGSTDHTAYTWAGARPAAVDLTFSPNISVRATYGHAAGSAPATVLGVKRAGEAGGGSAGIGVGETERLHTNEVSFKELL
jgi:hypothetical protein